MSEPDRFVQGFCCAVHILAGSMGEHSAAKMLFEEGGFTLDDLDEHEIEECDKETIINLFKEYT